MSRGLHITQNRLAVLPKISGYVFDQGNGFWIKVIAQKGPPRIDAVHGIQFRLSLFHPEGHELMRFDNAEPFGYPDGMGGKYQFMFYHYDFSHKTGRSITESPQFVMSDTASELFERFFEASDPLLEAFGVDLDHESEEELQEVPHVMSQRDMRERILAVTRKRSDTLPRNPNVAFASMQAYCHVLNPENHEMLRTIYAENSVPAHRLAVLTGFEIDNVIMRLGILARYNFIKLAFDNGQILASIR